MNPPPVPDPYAEGYAAGLAVGRAQAAAWLRAEANRVMASLEPADRPGYARVYSALHRSSDAIATPAPDPTSDKAQE